VLVREKQTIPALLTKAECNKYQALYGKDDPYVANYGITCKDEDSQTGITINWFAPSINVKQSTDAIRALIQDKSFYIPTNSNDGEVNIRIKMDGATNEAPYTIETFELKDGQWKTRSMELVSFGSEEAASNAESLEQDVIQEYHEFARKPPYSQLNTCSTPGPVKKDQKSKCSPNVKIPQGRPITFETGEHSHNAVGVKGISDWKDGETTFEVRGHLGAQGKWYPQEIRKKELVNEERGRDSDSSKSSEADQNDEDEKQDDSLLNFFEKSNFIDDSYQVNGLGMTRKAKPKKPARRNMPMVQEYSERSQIEQPVYKNTRLSTNKKVNITRRRQRTAEVDDDPPMFTVSKPRPDDDLWSYVYRLANDYSDHRTFYGLTPSQVDIPSVTRLMLKFMIDFGLVSTQMRGLRAAASTSTSFQDFITNIIRLSGNIGSITTELNSLKFDVNLDDIYSFLFKIFAYMRLVYDYRSNDQIPKPKIFHHLSLAFNNCLPLRRFFSEVVKYQLTGTDDLDLDEMADTLRSFLADQEIFQRSNKKKNVNSIQIADAFIGKSKVKDNAELQSQNQNTDESDGFQAEPKKQKIKSNRSNTGLSSNTVQGKSEDYLRETLDKMNEQISNQSFYLNELMLKTEEKVNNQWHVALQKVLELNKGKPVFKDGARF